MTGRRAWIGLGTNLGQREANLAAAVAALQRLTFVEAVSGVYEAPPFGYAEQPFFLNMVVRGRTTLPAHELLHSLKRLELELGRVPSFRMGPRLIDLDLLLYDDVVLEEPGLTLPHPGIAARAFVLAPLLELDPDLRDPRTGRRFADAFTPDLRAAVSALGSAAEVLPLVTPEEDQ